jgi:hypothetical protein
MSSRPGVPAWNQSVQLRCIVMSGPDWWRHGASGTEAGELAGGLHMEEGEEANLGVEVTPIIT